jgi:hypothetical protein
MGFKRLEPEDFLISANSTTNTVWTNNVPTLTAFYTSSTQVASNIGDYYYTIYSDSDLENNEFDLIYCDKEGSGSVWYNTAVPNVSPSKTMYGQYRNLILADENADFVFGNYTAKNFYAIAVNRANYKEKLFPNNLTLQLLGSDGEISLTTDALVAPSIVFKDAGRVYNLVSGSVGSVYTGTNANGWAGGSSATSGSYGWFLPDVGVILFNAAALNGTTADGGIGLNTLRTSNTNTENPSKLFNALNGGELFTLNSEETLTSNLLFIRARNSEFNYSENPSYISGSSGELTHEEFIDNPQSYITSVGLYNDNNELVAVAKLSRPLLKDSTKELLLRVKLDFVWALFMGLGFL